MSKQSPLEGILWMVVTGLCFVAVTATVRLLGDAIPAAEAAFLRYILGLVFLIPMVKPLLGTPISRKQYYLFGLRGLVHTLAVTLWFFAMARIPIAEVTALNYLSPVYVTLGATLVLGERLPPRRLLAVFAALVGALLILRPGMRTIEPGHIAMLAAAVLFAVGYMTAKKLSGELNASIIVVMLSLTVPMGLAPLAFAVWVTPTLYQLAMLFLVAGFATLGHYTMTRAFAAAPLTVTQPVSFLQLVWAVSLGALFFGEPVDAWVIAGGALIVLAISFIAWREAIARRRLTPSHLETKI